MALDKIKDLIKEVIKTGDEDLIELATALLKNTNTETKPDKPRVNTATGNKPAIKSDKYQDFTSEIKTTDNPGRSIPVNQTKRFNTFVDDRTEAIGEEFKTPEIQPTERKREPTKKVDQECKKCGKITKVHPTHKREWFYCEKCLGSMGRL